MVGKRSWPRRDRARALRSAGPLGDPILGTSQPASCPTGFTLLVCSRQVLPDRVSLRRRTTSLFAASVISSVIALAKPANRSEQTKADETIRKRQVADSVRLGVKIARIHWAFTKSVQRNPASQPSSKAGSHSERRSIISNSSPRERPAVRAGSEILSLFPIS